MEQIPNSSPIEIQVEKASQLFHTLDPVPFRERDLDREAEEFIVGWARELQARKSIRIVIHLPESEAQSELGRELGRAINQYFFYRAENATRELHELFRMGRYSLMVGLSVLAICVAAARFLSQMIGNSELIFFTREGLLILGWVANWRPIEIFLYEWWPIVRKRRLYSRLAVAETTLLPR